MFPSEDLGLGVQQSFRQVVKHINADKTILNDTRVDTDIQFAENDQYDAYQKICTEMQYRCANSYLNGFTFDLIFCWMFIIIIFWGDIPVTYYKQIGQI